MHSKCFQPNAADIILSLAKSDDEKSENADTIAFLRELLCDGEMEYLVIKREAASQGITDKMLCTARIKLNLENRRSGNAYGKNIKQYWGLRDNNESSDP